MALLINPYRYASGGSINPAGEFTGSKGFFFDCTAANFNMAQNGSGSSPTNGQSPLYITNSASAIGGYANRASGTGTWVSGTYPYFLAATSDTSFVMPTTGTTPNMRDVLSSCSYLTAIAAIRPSYGWVMYFGDATKETFRLNTGSDQLQVRITMEWGGII
jgi:hypothetical protein